MKTDFHKPNYNSAYGSYYATAYLLLAYQCHKAHVQI
jgi:hypothetical protein